MQNNNSKLNTALLVILIIFVAIGAWFLVHKKGGTGGENIVDTQTETPNTQTQTNQNPNGPDYQPNKNIKTYSADGFSFNYDASGSVNSVKSGITQDGSAYAEILDSGNKIVNTLHFYAGTLPPNFRPEFYTGTTIINGKTFYYGDVQTNGGVVREYMYKENGKTLLIQDSDLIDLGSVEITSDIVDGAFSGIIKNISKTNGKYYLDIDYVQVASSSQEAMQWAREDGKCTTDCSAFAVRYIRNTNPKIRTIEIDSSASIKFDAETFTPAQADTSSMFIGSMSSIVIKDGKVVFIRSSSAG